MKYLAIGALILCVGCAETYTLGSVLRGPNGATRVAKLPYEADKAHCADQARAAAEASAITIRMDRRLQRTTWVGCMTAKGYTVTPGID